MISNLLGLLATSCVVISAISYFKEDMNGMILYGIVALFLELDSLKHKIIEKK